MADLDSPPRPAAPADRGPDDAAPSQWAAGHVIGAVVVGLVVGALFNAQALLATAERQPFGWQRDVAMAFAEPLASVSGAIGLDRPRHAIDVALGRADVATEIPPDDRGVPIAATGDPTPSPAATGGQPSLTPTTAPPATPSPSETTRGPVTAADPLRLYIGGDSMVEIQFGMALEDLADDTGLVETVAIDFDRGSGLSRPDFVDWPAKLGEVSRTHEPDAMVVYFGGNDAQPLEIDGAVHEPEAPEWQAEYRGRVAALMDQLAETGTTVYWMGLPIPRDAKMQGRFGMLNDIYASEAESRDPVTFVPAWDLFAAEDGTYSEYLPNQNGEVVDMRLDDGIHLTTAGAYRLARVTIATIAEDFGIEVAGED